jgi:hypothetical protein
LWPHRARLAWFSAIFVGGVAAGIGLAQWLTHGWFLWHVVTANTNEPDLSTFATLMGSFLQFNGLPILAALASLSLSGGPGERVWRAYFVGCCLTLPALAKLGASSNYWLELTAATTALLVLASCHLAAAPATRLVAPTLLAGSLLIAVPGYQAATVQLVGTAQDVIPLQPATPEQPAFVSLVSDSGVAPYRVDARFIERVAREPGELLTDNSGLAVAAGKRIMYEFQIFQLLGAEGHWSEQPILDAIQARRFSLVALMHPLDGPVAGTRWSPALQSALQAAYEPAGADAGFWLYRPRQ